MKYTVHYFNGNNDIYLGTNSANDYFETEFNKDVRLFNSFEEAENHIYEANKNWSRLTDWDMDADNESFEVKEIQLDETKDTTENKKVVVVISGGMVQNIFSNAKNIEYNVIDLDVSTEEEYVSVRNEYNNVMNNLKCVW